MAERMPEAMVVIIDLPLWNALATRLRALARMDENAPDAALRTVDQADEAKLVRLANGDFIQPIAEVAIERMPDHADDAKPAARDHADPATPATHLNGADTTE